MREKGKRLSLALLRAFLATIACTADRAVIIVDHESFFRALGGAGMAPALLLALFVWWFYRPRPQLGGGVRKGAAALALLFSLCEVIGYNADYFGAIFQTYCNAYILSFGLLLLCSWFVLLRSLLEFLLDAALRRSCPRSELAPQRRHFYQRLGVLLLAWGIYYVLFFPGVTTWDSYYQINQGLGFVPLTDEHPFLHTLLQGLLVRAGRGLFGSIYPGIALASFVQLLVLALFAAAVLQRLEHWHIHRTLRVGLLGFYALHPVVAAYSITLWKDVWMGMFVLLYALAITALSVDAKKFFGDGKNVLLLTLLMLAILFSKGTGIALLLLSLPFLLVQARGRRAAVGGITLACLGVFFAVRIFVMPSLGISKGHIREPMSVPLQQIARTVRDHGGEVSEEQRSIIDEILPFDQLGELYDPKLSDPVKGALREEVFRADVPRYAALWLQLGAEYPKAYAESFLANSCGYWYPGSIYWLITSQSYYDMLQMYRENGWTIYDEDAEHYQPLGSPWIRERLAIGVNYHMRQIPGLNLFLSVGAWFWALAFGYVTAKKKGYRYLMPAYALMAGVFLLCVASPLYCEMRYAYAALLTAPSLLALTFSENLNMT